MSSFEHITIDGSAAFVAATQRALALLRRTPSWSLALPLRSIRELQNEAASSGGYLFGSTEVNVGRATWNASPQYYASMIAHEGCHSTRGSAYGAEEERAAFAAQAKALRELGASRSEIAYCERHGRNPTHHVQWEQDWNAQVGRAAPAQATPATTQPERKMGAIERMAHAYHAQPRKGWFS